MICIISSLPALYLPLTIHLALMAWPFSLILRYHKLFPNSGILFLLVPLPGKLFFYLIPPIAYFLSQLSCLKLNVIVFSEKFILSKGLHNFLSKYHVNFLHSIYYTCHYFLNLLFICLLLLFQCIINSTRSRTMPLCSTLWLHTWFSP